MEAKSILRALLHKDPEKRLGTNGGMNEILSHSFFRKIDMSLLAQRKLPPPLKPDPMQNNYDEKES
jgi:hypothetical protein